MSKALLRSTVSFVALIAMVGLNIQTAMASGWTFKVSNEGKSKIERVEVSEDGSEWGVFTASELAPGESSTMEWASSTDNSSCEWKLRAVYSDGSMSEPASFDFCKETHLVFDN